VTVARAVWFAAAHRAEVREEAVRDPGPGEVLVRARVSLISAGTELVVYQGRADATDPLPRYSQGDYGFPIKYAYQVVGVVEKAGADAGFEPGQRVFVRHPHQDLMTVDAQERGVVPVPDEVSDDQASFLNLARVAHTAIFDVPPRAGDTVVVFGAGIVGLLCARFAQRTAHRVIVVDPRPARRALALARGATAAVAPDELAGVVEQVSRGRGVDISYETSGAGPALQSAIDVAGQEGSIVVVSYYGHDPVGLRLAPEFHWRRIKLVSSHASVLSYDAPRWDATRRNEEVFAAMSYLDVEQLISHRFPLTDASGAYRLLDEAGRSTTADVIGAVFDYPR
jgi:2-desacetyl-2-hydroxyethyl bacteriochlorophyllide A dehydrogenase